MLYLAGSVDLDGAYFMIYLFIYLMLLLFTLHISATWCMDILVRPTFCQISDYLKGKVLHFSHLNICLELSCLRWRESELVIAESNGKRNTYWLLIDCCNATVDEKTKIGWWNLYLKKKKKAR